MPYRKIKEFTDEELLDTINKKRAKMLALQKEIGHIQTYLLLKRLVGGGKNDQQCKEKTIQTTAK